MFHLKTALLAAAALALAACATGPTPYQPLGESKFGFAEQAIESDRFRVTFVGKTEGEARDLALLRAAEIARETGYSHFEVIAGATEGTRRRGGGTSVGVGVGSGRGYYGRGTNVGVGVGLDLGQLLGGGGGRVAHTIEVKLRRGPSDTGNVFSAAGVLESIGGRATEA